MMGALISKFRELVDTDKYEIERESILLRKYIKTTLESKGYQWFIPNKKGCSMFYKPNVFHDCSLKSLFNILVEKETIQASVIVLIK